MTILEQIKEKLQCLEPDILEIIDQSSSHVGHIAIKGKNNLETHFAVKIISDHFLGKSMVARHKLVYKLLELEFSGHLHALSLKTLTKEEAFLS